MQNNNAKSVSIVRTDTCTFVGTIVSKAYDAAFGDALETEIGLDQ
jgi:hypothetical protein